jgi:hypothetical protein
MTRDYIYRVTVIYDRVLGRPCVFGAVTQWQAELLLESVSLDPTVSLVTVSIESTGVILRRYDRK